MIAHIQAGTFPEQQRQVGKAIKACINSGVVKREEIFVTSKLWNTMHDPDLVKPALEKTLKDLGLEYLDLYLIHWPTGYQEKGGRYVPDPSPNSETWKAMEKCVEAGLVKSIGISNFNKTQTEEILKESKIKPAVNQIESNPFIPQVDLIDFCKKNGIEITAYSPVCTPSSM